MPKLRRIVFGEPRPGFAQLAGVLARLDESVSYCNHTILPLRYDHITDVPFTIMPALPFVHPTPLITDKIGVLGQGFDLFSEHHMPLYWAGAQILPDPVHVEAARLCNAIYAKGDVPTEPWDAQQVTQGVTWAAKWEGTRLYLVHRGTDDLLDLVRDLTIIDPARLLHHDTFGPVWGGFNIGMPETYAAQKSLIADAEEVVVTGHSLGASRADLDCAYILSN